MESERSEFQHYKTRGSCMHVMKVHWSFCKGGPVSQDQSTTRTRAWPVVLWSWNFRTTAWLPSTKLWLVISCSSKVILVCPCICLHTSCLGTCRQVIQDTHPRSDKNKIQLWHCPIQTLSESGVTWILSKLGVTSDMSKLKFFYWQVGGG